MCGVDNAIFMPSFMLIDIFCLCLMSLFSFFCCHILVTSQRLQMPIKVMISVVMSVMFSYFPIFFMSNDEMMIPAPPNIEKIG